MEANMKKNSKLNYLPLIITLIIISFGFFAAQSYIFGDVKYSMFLLFQDFIFLPIEVILVSILIDKFISDREKNEKLMKLNILINEFFCGSRQ